MTDMLDNKTSIDFSLRSLSSFTFGSEFRVVSLIIYCCLSVCAVVLLDQHMCIWQVCALSAFACSCA